MRNRKRIQTPRFKGLKRNIMGTKITKTPKKTSVRDPITTTLTPTIITATITPTAADLSVCTRVGSAQTTILGEIVRLIRWSAVNAGNWGIELMSVTRRIKLT